MMAYTYNPSIQEAERDESTIQGRNGLREQTLSQKNQSCERFEKIKKLKGRKKGKKETKLRLHKTKKI